TNGGEAGALESFGYLASPEPGDLGACARGARLRHDRDAATGGHYLAEILQARVRVAPHAERVYRKNFVERPIESGKVSRRSQAEVHHSGAHGLCVSPPRLSDHLRGVIDSTDVTASGPPAKLGDGDAGAKSDLQDPVRRADLQQADRPLVALAVGRP